MTTNQLIALLFPVGTAAAVGLTAFGITRWVNWKYARKEPAPSPSAEESLFTNVNVEVVQALDEADHLIQQARRQLQRAS